MKFRLLAAFLKSHDDFSSFSYVRTTCVVLQSSHTEQADTEVGPCTCIREELGSSLCATSQWHGDWVVSEEWSRTKFNSARHRCYCSGTCSLSSKLHGESVHCSLCIVRILLAWIHNLKWCTTNFKLWSLFQRLKFKVELERGLFILLTATEVDINVISGTSRHIFFKLIKMSVLYRVQTK
jgi:hypothetical protein